MGQMAVMGSSGDTKVVWDKDNADEVATARATFDGLTKKGFTAWSVTGEDGRKGEQIRRFDPEAERVILTPRMAGG
jgi:hypothetical protein